MSPAGTLAGFIGAATVAGTGGWLTRDPTLLVAGTAIGFGGMIVDSLVGTLWQGRFQCPDCETASEHRMHRCGTRTRHIGGLSWLDNDAVNALATAAAGVAGAVLWFLSATLAQA